MRCSSCEPLLDAYLEGTLGRRQARAIGAHLRSCPNCTALLGELRVVDALLTTARPHKVAPDFTSSVVSATKETHPRLQRRMPVVVALLLYVVVAWTLIALGVLRGHEFVGLVSAFAAGAQRDLAAVGAAARALSPATPMAAAAMTGVLLIDLLLLCAIFYGYRRLRPAIALYLDRGPRS